MTVNTLTQRQTCSNRTVYHRKDQNEEDDNDEGDIIETHYSRNSLERWRSTPVQVVSSLYHRQGLVHQVYYLITLQIHCTINRNLLHLFFLYTELVMLKEERTINV